MLWLPIANVETANDALAFSSRRMFGLIAFPLSKNWTVPVGAHDLDAELTVAVSETDWFCPIVEYELEIVVAVEPHIGLSLLSWM